MLAIEPSLHYMPKLSKGQVYVISGQEYHHAIRAAALLYGYSAQVQHGLRVGLVGGILTLPWKFNELIYNMHFALTDSSEAYGNIDSVKDYHQEIHRTLIRDKHVQEAEVFTQIPVSNKNLDLLIVCGYSFDTSDMERNFKVLQKYAEKCDCAILFIEQTETLKNWVCPTCHIVYDAVNSTLSYTNPGTNDVAMVQHVVWDILQFRAE